MQNDRARAEMGKHLRDRPLGVVRLHHELTVVQAAAELVQATDRGAQRLEGIVHRGGLPAGGSRRRERAHPPRKVVGQQIEAALERSKE